MPQRFAVPMLRANHILDHQRRSSLLGDPHSRFPYAQVRDGRVWVEHAHSPLGIICAGRGSDNYGGAAELQTVKRADVLQHQLARIARVPFDIEADDIVPLGKKAFGPSA
jgi:hypothetical protein